MKKCLIFSILCLGICVKSIAQIDTEFWFAAPDLSQNHAQTPVRFCISTFDDAATIVFEQPANPSYAPITFHLYANDFLVYDVSNILSMVETQPCGTILNYGFHIYSTAPVSIYYESNNCNSEIYSLKGTNALGTNFIVPSQYTFPNSSYYPGNNRTEVVATQDETVITFVPSVPIKGGGQPGVPITITLNRGQCYALEANGRSGLEHIRNTTITSNKPIAVNSSDDSVDYYSAAQDLIGDQIVPINLVGHDYIALWNNTPNEYLYFFPTQNNTSIYINGNQIPEITLNLGQEFNYALNTYATFVHADKPIVVFQLASNDYHELGGTMLPHIKCTGSRRTVYKRNELSDIVITLVVKSDYVDYFRLNGNASYLTTADFHAVPSNSNYSYCIKDVSQYVPNDGLLTIENDIDDGYFQFGVFTNSYGTCSYGYFSNYNEYAYGSFNMDNTYCSGDKITFEYASEGIAEPSLLQPDGSIITQQPFVIENVQSSQSGRYYLQGIACDGIQELDYIDIFISSTDTTKFDVYSCNPPYYWNGLTYDNPGNYEQLFANHAGCDSIVQLSLEFYEQNDLEIDTFSCKPIQWQGELLSESGIYSNHFITTNGCDSLVTLNLSIGVSSDYSIQGKTSIYPSTDITSGIYQYRIDSTGINPANVHWSIDREDWLLFPNGASCDLLCSSAGRGILHAWTEGESCDVDTTLIINAAFYGTEENEAETAAIYPNPTNGNVTVSWQDIVAVKVYNMFGQKVNEHKFVNQNEIVLDLQDYQKGVYVLEISSSNGKVYRSVVLTE